MKENKDISNVVESIVGQKREDMTAEEKYEWVKPMLKIAYEQSFQLALQSSIDNNIFIIIYPDLKVEIKRDKIEPNLPDCVVIISFGGFKGDEHQKDNLGLIFQLGRQYHYPALCLKVKQWFENCEGKKRKKTENKK